MRRFKMYWIESNDNSNITTIRTLVDGQEVICGAIEKPYNFDNIYLVTDSNHCTLSQNGSFIFRDFEAAKNKIIEHWEYEMEVLKG
jgi:hypothetical protein